jgi:hypothetical protein
MGKRIADEGYKRADCRLPGEAFDASVHLRQERNRDYAAHKPADRSEAHVLEAERCKNAAPRHHQKAGEPGARKFFGGRAQEAARLKVAEAFVKVEFPTCHGGALP